MFDREDPIALIDGATVRHLDGNHDLAIADFSRAIVLKPDATEAFYGRGLVHQHVSALDKAVADYGKAIELDPGHVDALFKRSAAHRLLGDFAEAAADFDRAIQLLWHKGRARPGEQAIRAPRSPGPESEKPGRGSSSREQTAS